MPDRLPQSGTSGGPDPKPRPSITRYSVEQPSRSARAGVSPARARRPRRPGRLAAILAVVAMLLFSGVVVARQIAAAGASPTSMGQPAAPGISDRQPPPVRDDSGTAPPAEYDSAARTVDVAAVAAKVSPAVVNITVRNGYTSSGGAGTGIVLTSDGHVLTNNHVIDGATEISAVALGNGETYRAEVVGYDATQDIALIKLQDASGLPTADIGDSTPAVGDAVVGVGNAGGDGGAPTVVAGIVLALDQQIVARDQSGDAEQLSGLIHTEADVQSGHSGGPLANADGEVIGVMTAASVTVPYHGPASSDTEGFAIPMTTAVAIVDQIRRGDESGTVHIGPTAFLGVQTTDAGAQDPYGYGSSQSGATSGARVAGVVPGSPAAGAGLTPGDVITAVEGVAVTSAEGLGDLIAAHHPGDAVTITWTDSAGAVRSVVVGLAEGPAR